MLKHRTVLFLTSRFRLFQAHETVFRKKALQIEHCARVDDLLFFLHQRQACRAIVLDFMHWPAGALTTLQKIAGMQGQVPVLVVLPADRVQLLAECLKLGVYDFLFDPPVIRELVDALHRICDLNWHGELLQARRNNWQREKFLFLYPPNSMTMIDRFRRLAAAARKDEPVTLVAHPHADREFYARLIHFFSYRRFQSFITMDCRKGERAIEEIIESAKIKKKNQNQATLYFEQISALSFENQLKLVDFYDNMDRLNGDAAAPYRIILSSQYPLSDYQSRGFSKEFIDKLLGTPIDIPPLRQHQEDIEPIVDQLVRFYADQWHKSIEGIEEVALDKLYHYDWPGDFVELKNVLERAVMFCDHSRIRLEDLPPGIQSFNHVDRSIELRLNSYNLVDAEELLIGHVLRGNNGNISRSATTLGISRGTLYNKLKKYGLEHLIRR